MRLTAYQCASWRMNLSLGQNGERGTTHSRHGGQRTDGHRSLLADDSGHHRGRPANFPPPPGPASAFVAQSEGAGGQGRPHAPSPRGTDRRYPTRRPWRRTGRPSTVTVAPRRKSHAHQGAWVTPPTWTFRPMKNVTVPSP